MRKLLLTLLFWLVFFLIWSRLMYYYVDDIPNRLYFSILDVSLVMVTFYVIYLYIMPRYFRRKNIWQLLVSCILLIGVLSAFASWLMLLFLRHALMPIHFNLYWNYNQLQYNRIFIALIGVLAGCFVKLAMDRFALSKRMEQVEKEKSIAELTYLKSQINPHFLFNSINSLYAQMELSPEKARYTLASIADLLRYQLYDCNAEKIPVSKEIEYLNNYFKLQSLRMDNCICTFEVTGNTDHLSTAPLLLIPFVENAFKYVSDSDEGDNRIEVQLTFTSGKLLFSCLNTVDGNKEPEGRGGIGLANVKKRLELIYGEDYSLQINNIDNLFKVLLEINLENA